jgi:hypothetical protein
VAAPAETRLVFCHDRSLPKGVSPAATNCRCPVPHQLVTVCADVPFEFPVLAVHVGDTGQGAPWQRAYDESLTVEYSRGGHFSITTSRALTPVPDSLNDPSGSFSL